MPDIGQYLIFIVIIAVIYFIARRFSKKEAKSFVEENLEPKEAQNIETVDALTEILVDFVFLSKKDQFMINSFPNLIINNLDKYKMMDDKLSLKLPPKFNLHFGVPYLKGEAFKLDESYNLKQGRKYRITFKPKAFVFNKPKITVEEIGTL